MVIRLLSSGRKTGPQLWDAVKAEKPTVANSSYYRVLEQLEREGSIRRNIVERKIYYEVTRGVAQRAYQGPDMDLSRLLLDRALQRGEHAAAELLVTVFQKIRFPKDVLRQLLEELIGHVLKDTQDSLQITFSILYDQYQIDKSEDARAEVRRIVEECSEGSDPSQLFNRLKAQILRADGRANRILRDLYPEEHDKFLEEALTGKLHETVADEKVLDLVQGQIQDFSRRNPGKVPSIVGVIYRLRDSGLPHGEKARTDLLIQGLVTGYSS